MLLAQEGFVVLPARVSAHLAVKLREERPTSHFRCLLNSAHKTTDPSKWLFRTGQVLPESPRCRQLHKSPSKRHWGKMEQDILRGEVDAGPSSQPWPEPKSSSAVPLSGWAGTRAPGSKQDRGCRAWQTVNLGGNNSCNSIFKKVFS